MVSEFVHKNLQELVSLSLNNWFSSSGILFHDGGDDSKRSGPSKQSIRKIHKEVRQLSARMMKSWRVLQPAQIRPLNPSSTMVDEGTPPSESGARLSDRLVSHDFLMIRGKYAVSDMRRPGFVMGQRDLPARCEGEEVSPRSGLGELCRHSSQPI
ncbi:MAG: hypothetical protein KVP17_004548 [Porospora cf. gigantea B]|uniref:uncharacterized protein n=1 Tax=Porospora cf. gigantea B TaxID=2853592 RepID=UPI003571CBFF|nr:MAG: hypothetical protein KVP17_004548 [Porospora cf. gigantea B]